MVAVGWDSLVLLAVSGVVICVDSIGRDALTGELTTTAIA